MISYPYMTIENNFEEENERIAELEPTAESPKAVDKNLIDGIRNVDEKVFPENMQLPTEVMEGILNNPRSAIVVLRETDDSISGYVVADPLEDVISILKKEDPNLELIPEAGYVESVAVIPEKRNFKNFNSLIKTFISTAKDKGYKVVTMHARTSNELSTILQNRYGAKFERRVENWYGFGEAFDYLVMEL